jgi:hypothetical protein
MKNKIVNLLSLFFISVSARLVKATRHIARLKVALKRARTDRKFPRKIPYFLRKREC